MKLCAASPERLLVIFSIAAACAGCFNRTPRQIPVAAFTDCFVNPTPAKMAGLVARPADTGALFAALREQRKRSPAGYLREVLSDTFDFPWHLGILTPPAFRCDTAYPLVIYLHGGTGAERIDKGDSALFMLRALADSVPLFLASPSANRYAPWWSAAGLSRILQSVRYLTLRYPVDPAKIFLAGVSDGATGCWAAANAIPAPFAGFIAVSGFGGMLPALGMQLYPGNMALRPIYSVNAGHDRLYPLDQVRQFVAAMQQQAVPVTLKIYPDEQHGFDYKEREMGTLAGLVRKWKRPEPSAVNWNFVAGCPNLPDNIIDWNAVSDNAFVETSLRADTLTVRASGLRSFIYALPGGQEFGKIVCRFAEGGSKVISPTGKNWQCRVSLLFNRCFPEMTQAGFYRIKP